jgi:hypothetical protein
MPDIKECGIDLGRRSVLAMAVGALPLISALNRHGSSTFAVSPSAPKGHIADFDFLVGDWRVHHQALAGKPTTWHDYEGRCSMQKVLAGQANLDDHIWQNSTTTYRAVTLRSFDPEHRTWSIFWLDSRFPATVGPPVIGGFEGNRGIFYGDDTANGRPVRVRFFWFLDGPNLCRWEQAYSSDKQRTWETNWRMRFERTADLIGSDARRSKE